MTLTTVQFYEGILRRTKRKILALQEKERYYLLKLGEHKALHEKKNE